MTTDFLETFDVKLIEQTAQEKRLNEVFERGKTYHE